MATGRRFTTRGITVVRVAEGKIVEDWHVGDHLGLFEQLGLIAVSQPIGMST
ncbi:MAG TPA: ester cyclase [Ktedonobacteraceae bacterium]|nr:ester cyclase [Ktedonobacteraceae bacterium]